MQPKQMHIRRFEEKDFFHIQQLNEEEGWTNLAEKSEETKAAWKHSDVAFVAECNGVMAGYMRGLTDGVVTLYVCELLVKKEYRGCGIGKALLKHAHSFYPKTRMELLASSTSKTYYEQLGFRSFSGYRITMPEWEK